jgi:uncharacterized protein YjeT (DUF2065 family)
MKDFATALALVLVSEGIPYLFADGMKRLMAQATALPAAALRATGWLPPVWGLRRYE